VQTASTPAGARRLTQPRAPHVEHLSARLGTQGAGRSSTGMAMMRLAGLLPMDVRVGAGEGHAALPLVDAAGRRR
jgi:hypothetical protein